MVLLESMKQAKVLVVIFGVPSAARHPVRRCRPVMEQLRQWVCR